MSIFRDCHQKLSFLGIPNVNLKPIYCLIILLVHSCLGAWAADIAHKFFVPSEW